MLGHILPLSATADNGPHHFSHLSPTFFLERAASIEPRAEAVYHVTANGKVLRRSYMELADRARGLAYYLRKKGLRRVGLLAPNTPAFLEAVYGIVAAGGVMVPVNIRLKPDDVAYIFDFAEVDSIIVDAEYEGLLDAFRKTHPNVTILVDLVRVSVSAPLARPTWNCWLTEACLAPGHGCYRGCIVRAVRRGGARGADVRPGDGEQGVV